MHRTEGWSFSKTPRILLHSTFTLLLMLDGCRRPVAPTPPPPPAIPITMSCRVSPSAVSAGDPVQATSQIGNAVLPVQYSWSTTGGKIDGEGAVVSILTDSLSAGDYTVTVNARDREDWSHLATPISP